jgi:17beta-estradiol 17-dehydrogenase / very-long-chain 3-oxoacyl-CoA reductase
VKAALSGKDVGVLVNNVGVSYPHPKYFHELTDAELQGLTTLNVTSTVAMTRLALPAMLEKRKGAIVNMASAAAVAPTALLSGYSGAKGYVLKLSESLNVEYAPKGIHVQCQVPLLVATKVRHTLHISLIPAMPVLVLVCVGNVSRCSSSCTLSQSTAINLSAQLSAHTASTAHMYHTICFVA